MKTKNYLILIFFFFFIDSCKKIEVDPNIIDEGKYLKLTNEDFEKSLIFRGIDSNPNIDGKILLEEVKIAERLWLPSNIGKDIPLLKYFQNIKALYIEDYGYQNLDLSSFSFLKWLYIYHNIDFEIKFPRSLETLFLVSRTITKIPFDKIPSSIKKLSLNYEAVTNINMPIFPNLKSLGLYGYNVNSIEISKLNNINSLDLVCSLDKINLENNKLIDTLSINAPLKEIDISNQKQLLYFKFNGTYTQYLSKINLANNLKLKHLSIFNFSAEIVDVSKLEQLKNLEFGSLLEGILIKKETKIQFPQLNNIENLWVVNNVLKDFDLTQFKKIKKLNLYNNNLKNFNLPNESMLSLLILGGQEIEVLNLKGQNKLTSIYLKDNVNLNKICVDNLKYFLDLEKNGNPFDYYSPVPGLFRDSYNILEECK